MSKQNKINLGLVLSIIIMGFGFFYTPDTKADANIGVSAFNIDTDIADFRGINLDVGYDFSDILGVRASYMIGADDEVVGGVNVEITQMYSLDAIVSFPVSDSLNPFITVGQTHMAAKASYQGYSATASDNFTTYGAGLQFDLREAVSISGEVKNIEGDLMTLFSVQANF